MLNNAVGTSIVFGPDFYGMLYACVWHLCWRCFFDVIRLCVDRSFYDAICSFFLFFAVGPFSMLALFPRCYMIRVGILFSVCLNTFLWLYMIVFGTLFYEFVWQRLALKWCLAIILKCYTMVFGLCVCFAISSDVIRLCSAFVIWFPLLVVGHYIVVDTVFLRLYIVCGPCACFAIFCNVIWLVWSCLCLIWLQLHNVLLALFIVTDMLYDSDWRCCRRLCCHFCDAIWLCLAKKNTFYDVICLWLARILLLALFNYDVLQIYMIVYVCCWPLYCVLAPSCAT